jgi:hypothetical protein
LEQIAQMEKELLEKQEQEIKDLNEKLIEKPINEPMASLSLYSDPKQPSKSLLKKVTFDWIEKKQKKAAKLQEQRMLLAEQVAKMPDLGQLEMEMIQLKLKEMGKGLKEVRILMNSFNRLKQMDTVYIMRFLINWVFMEK